MPMLTTYNAYTYIFLWYWCQGRLLRASFAWYIYIRQNIMDYYHNMAGFSFKAHFFHYGCWLLFSHRFHLRAKSIDYQHNTRHTELLMDDSHNAAIGATHATRHHRQSAGHFHTYTSSSFLFPFTLCHSRSAVTLLLLLCQYRQCHQRLYYEETYIWSSFSTRFSAAASTLLYIYWYMRYYYWRPPFVNFAPHMPQYGLIW